MAIAVIAIGVAGIAGSLASAEISAKNTQAQSRLEAAMRLDTDLLRGNCQASPGPCGTQNGIAYVLCATTYTSSSFAPGTSPVTVVEATSGTVGSGLYAMASCSGGVSDYGVQRITVKVTDSLTGLSLQRDVYKKWNGQ